MFALLSLAIIVTTFIFVTGLTVSAIEESYEFKTIQDSWVIERVMTGVEYYYVENGAYPASISVLDDTELEAYIYFSRTTDRFKYRVASSLTDGFWEFDRAASLFEDPKNTVDNFSVTDPVFDSTAHNSCGVGTFDNDADWCPRSGSMAIVLETREYANSMNKAVIFQLDSVLSKIAKAYSATGQFPSFGIGAGNSQSIRTIASYTGTPATCQGSFSIQNVEFDCGDLYSIGGSQVEFNYISPTHIAVSLRTPFRNSSGQNISISRELRAE